VNGVYPPGVFDVLEGNTQFCVCQRDALELLDGLPPESIDAVITDAPYSSGGAFRGDRVGSTKTKYVKRGARVVGPDFMGDTRDQLSQLAWCSLWLSKAFRAAKIGAPIVLWSDWRQLALSITALQCGGWIYRGIVPWTKKGAGRPQRGRFRSDAEFAVWGSKGPMPRDRAVGGPCSVLAGHVQAAPIVASKRRHQTEKPVEDVMRDLVRICTPGGVILDPFTGGGSTGIAALLEGYRFVGSEVIGEYCERAARAIEAAAA
jgi:site-specific DNA-methyltransferase (adenine-specific)